MQIGELLHRLQKTQGVSQNKMAKALGVSPSYLSLLERGKRPPTLRMMRRAAKQMGIAAGLVVLQSMEPAALEPRAGKLVEEIQRKFEKALSSGNFAPLQRRFPS